MPHGTRSIGSHPVMQRPGNALRPFDLLVIGITMGSIALSACGQSDEGAREDHARVATAAFAGSPARDVAAAAPLLSMRDRASFRRLAKQLGGKSALRVSAVGRRQPAEPLGDLDDVTAWSTIKVPIAVAVIQKNGARRDRQLLRAAITRSSNDAAKQLWSRLGPPRVAGRKVEGVLAAAGDRTTKVQIRHVRQGFTSFGQTRWPLAAQHRFIAGLQCVSKGRQVLGLMADVVPSQRWGLGSTGLPARFKGGWGPGLSGRYLVRQMGILELPNGRSLAVSAGTVASDGGFPSGTRNLTRVARWLRRHVNGAAVPPAAC